MGSVTGSGWRWAVLAILAVVTLAAAINRQLLFLVIEPLKGELGFSDRDIGVLTGLAPGLLAGLGVVVLGWLTDRTERHILLAICVVVWSFATAELGLAYTFSGFLLGIIALALGETAVTPVANSLIPDIFDGQLRIRANLIYHVIGAIAVGLGSLISGLLLGWVQETGFVLAFLPELNYWRTAFELVALLGIPLAALVLCIGKVNRRESGEEIDGAVYNSSLEQYFRLYGRVAVSLYISLALTIFAGMAVMSWTPSFIVRLYDVSPADVGFTAGLVMIIGSVSGAGAAALFMFRATPRLGVLAPRILFQITILLVAIPLILQLYASTAQQAYILYGLQIFFANTGLALSAHMVQSISPSHLRGRLFGIYGLVGMLLSSLAPLFTGMLSDSLHTYDRGLVMAVVFVAVPALVAAAGIMRATNKTYQAAAPSFELMR